MTSNLFSLLVLTAPMMKGLSFDPRFPDGPVGCAARFADIL